MNFYTHDQDKKSGDGLAITEWNTLSSAVAGNSGLHLATNPADRVGVGVEAPTAKLQVNGDVLVKSAEKNTNGLYITVGNGGGNGYLIQADQYNSGVKFKVDREGNTAVMGKLGVGTTNPASELHVKASGEVGILESTTETAFLKLYTKEGAGKRVEFCNRQGGRAAIYVNGSGDVLNVLANGRVGIGTETPTQRLEVNGTVKATKFVGDGSELTNLSVGVNGVNFATQSGNVGVGTTNPSSKLHVSSNSSEIARLSTTDPYGSLVISQKDGINKDVGIANNNGALQLWTSAVDNNNQNYWRLTIQQDGKVGIGTTTPSQQLEVSGTIKGTSLKIGQWEIYESGTTLIFRRNGTNQIKFDDNGRRIWSANKRGNSNWMDES